jgi:hypothetical protein
MSSREQQANHSWTLHDGQKSFEVGQHEHTAAHNPPRHRLPEALGARDAVQQRSTATVDHELEPDGRYQASDQRVRLHQTLPPTVVVQDVAGSSPVTHPMFLDAAPSVV